MENKDERMETFKEKLAALCKEYEYELVGIPQYITDKQGYFNTVVGVSIMDVKGAPVPSNL